MIRSRGMNAMRSHAQVKKKLLKDPETRAAYEALGPEFSIIEAIIEKRIEKGMTQAALARKIGTKQSAIARLESGSTNPTLKGLEKIARALDSRLEASFS